jgi:hypothetical protein
MPKLPLIASAASAALMLSFAGPVHAAPALTQFDGAGLLVLVGDEENSEVQNELEPQSDQGTPMQNQGARNEGAAKPAGEAGGGGGESAQKALESTVGDDGVNAIQQESIPPE